MKSYREKHQCLWILHKPLNDNWHHQAPPHPTSEVSHGWNSVQWGFAVFKISQFIDMSVSEANSFYSLATDSSSCNALQWVMLCLGLSPKAAVNKVNEQGNGTEPFHPGIQITHWALCQANVETALPLLKYSSTALLLKCGMLKVQLLKILLAFSSLKNMRSSIPSYSVCFKPLSISCIVIVSFFSSGPTGLMFTEVWTVSSTQVHSQNLTP